jgi:hypothetical protein
MTQHGVRVRVDVQIVGGGEETAALRAHSQHGEVIARYELGAGDLGLRTGPDGSVQPVAAHHGAEDLVVVANVLIHEVGSGVAAVVAAIVSSLPCQQHDALRLPHRQQSQDELIDQREDRSIGADAERQ